MKRLLHHLRLIATLVVLASPVWAGEYVVLANGFRLHADRHEVEGDTVRIFTGAGAVEMAATAISSYEQEEMPAIVQPKTAASPAPSVAAKPGTPAEFATLAAEKYLLPDSFVRSVMKAESGFQQSAISSKGAIGLMQLMPATARELGVDPRDPYQNAAGGAQYLRALLAHYESEPDQVLLALAAYNAGPAAVDHYHGVPPFRETREYILRVLKDWNRASDSNSNK